MDKLFKVKALDVWFTPIVMKKNRPAIKLSALSQAQDRDAIIRIITRESSSIGVRCSEVDRVEIERKIVEVKTELGVIRVKVAFDGDDILNIAPEFEDCARIAREKNIALKEVFRIANAAYANVKSEK